MLISWYRVGGRYQDKQYNYQSDEYIVYKIPYRRARAWPLGRVLYTRYPIVARRAWPVQPLSRVRRASKGILHTRPSASREQRYLAYKAECVARAKVSCIQMNTIMSIFL